MTIEAYWPRVIPEQVTVPLAPPIEAVYQRVRDAGDLVAILTV
jgi:hypothetical protein